MAFTIQASFSKFKQNLEISDLQAGTVSTRQNSVREVVEEDLEVLDSFLSGSYMRNTLISPLKEADIDIFFVLDPKYYHHYNGQNGGQSGLLDRVKNVLKRTYTNTPKISRNGQAVSITFTDFIVDVVPCFNRQGGGFLIPNSNSQTWISTNPKVHVSLSSDANKKHNFDFVPLVKMIKRWNKYNGTYFRSFHLEVLALQIFTNVTITDFPSGIRYFFDKAIPLMDVQVKDPAGYDDDVGRYINGEKIKEAKSKLETALNRALKAEEYARNDKIELAVNEWIKIFGDYFPAFG